MSQIISMLTSRYQVLHVDYPRGTGVSTGLMPGDLIPETVAKDYVAVAEDTSLEFQFFSYCPICPR